MNWLHTEADLVIKGIDMNIEEQRKAFEVVAEKLGYQLDKWSDGEYVNDSTKTALKLWLASANRKGYKLVPVEPTLKMIEDAADEHVVHGASYSGIYKAMIGEETK